MAPPADADPHDSDDLRSALETLRAYLEGSRSIEAAARTLFVHANTVRYRLRRITELTGHDPTTPRGGLALQLALILGRQAGH